MRIIVIHRLDIIINRHGVFVKLLLVFVLRKLIKDAAQTGDKRKADVTEKKWYEIGYENGFRFAREEADYDELAAIFRTGKIPLKWDIFRAEILNSFIGSPDFDFQGYEAGFVRACTAFFEKI